MFIRLYLGLTQERIDECRGAKETAMLKDIQALVQSQADLNAPDDSGATVVSHRTGSTPPHVPPHQASYVITIWIRSVACYF